MLALVGAALTISAAAAMPSYVDGILAVVGDEVITVFDVLSRTTEMEAKLIAQYSPQEREQPLLQEQIQEQISQLRRQFAQELINEHLIYADFKRQQLTVPGGLVEARIDRVVAERAGGNRQRFEDLLEQTGATPEEYYERMNRKVAVDLMVNEEVDRKITISPEQVNRYYRENQSLFVRPSRLRLQMLQLAPEHLAEAADIARRARAGADFAELVRAYGTDALRDKGGDLGWMSTDELRAEFRQAFASMQAGAVTDPFDFRGDTFILRLPEIEAGDHVPRAEAEAEIRERLTAAARKERYKKYVDRLREQTYLKLYLKSEGDAPEATAAP